MKKFLVAILVVVMAVVLVGCAPKNVDAAKAKMEKAGYDVLVVGNTVTASKGLLSGKGLTAVYYETTKEAKEAYEKLTEDGKVENLTRTGNWVVYGEKEAVKAFK